MRILVVEDEKPLRDAIQKGLEKLGYAADTAADGEEALERYFSAPYDAIVLDLNLPKLPGLSVLEAIRADSGEAKVLILSARNEIDDRVLGFDTGANDYLGKPFAFRELEARLGALLRRNFSQAAPRIALGDVLIDTAIHRAFRQGDELPLSRKEYGILEYLAVHRGEVVRVDTLIEHIWAGDPEIYMNTFKVHLNSLRGKLPGVEITNVRGRGYYVK